MRKKLPSRGTISATANAWAHTFELVGGLGPEYHAHLVAAFKAGVAWNKRQSKRKAKR